MGKGKLDINYEQQNRSPIPINVGNVKQILCDDFFLTMAIKWDQLFYNVKFANGIVQKHGSRVMVGDDQPWETGLAWSNVIKLNKLYQL